MIGLDFVRSQGGGRRGRVRVRLRAVTAGIDAERFCFGVRKLNSLPFPWQLRRYCLCAFPCSRASVARAWPPCICVVPGSRAASHTGLQATSPCSGSCSECSAPSNTADAVRNTPRSLSRSLSSVTQSGLLIARMNMPEHQCRSQSVSVGNVSADPSTCVSMTLRSKLNAR